MFEINKLIWRHRTYYNFVALREIIILFTTLIFTLINIALIRECIICYVLLLLLQSFYYNLLICQFIIFYNTL